MDEPSHAAKNSELRADRSPLRAMLAHYADRLGYYWRLACYVLDGRPVHVTDLIRHWRAETDSI